MAKFTHTGLVRLLIGVLEHQMPDLVVDLVRPDPFDQATSDDDLKRQLIQRVVHDHGTGLLLDVGQHLSLADETPTLAILTQPQHAATLADKWMRLERYYHHAHRTRIICDGNTAWNCTRESESAKAPTTAGENCLIAGVLVGLAGLIGLQDVCLDVDGKTHKPETLRQLNLPGNQTLSQFRIRWNSSKYRARPLQDAAMTVPFSDRLTDVLAADIGRSWKVADAAHCMALSPRTLQRRLLAEHRTFSTVLRRARMRVATRHLTLTKTGLAEIGYCCGYADQAHFQRDFLRSANVTPQAFRHMSQTTPG
ncbi:MAG: helix-turn-helix transcriptional regulator [Pseudomonadota bacterium]